MATLAPRNALVSNLNFVHLQHVSLGVHLSLRPELKECPVTTDSGEGGPTGCRHTWKDTAGATQVDANSNDPSVECLCCEKHLGQVGTWLDSSRHMSEVLSPCDLPTSPLSPSSPCSDSSSSSDFSFDESPSSMCFKEYLQEGLGSPDEQPVIIPLDAAGEGHVSPTQQLYESSGDVSTVTNTNPITPQPQPSINYSGPNPDSKMAPLTSKGSPGEALDANSNAIPQGHSVEPLPCGCDKEVQWEAEGQESMKKNAAASHGVAPKSSWLFGADAELLPGLALGAAPEQGHRKNITSFNEMAQRRRRSTGWQPCSQAKPDKSDWLIIFSPDREHPPANELTTTAFYHQASGQRTPAAAAGKEVTTFRELKYRNELIKQNNQQIKARSTREIEHQNPTVREFGEPGRQPKSEQTAKAPRGTGKDGLKDHSVNMKDAEDSPPGHAGGGRQQETKPRAPLSAITPQKQGPIQPTITGSPGTGKHRSDQAVPKLYTRGIADGGDTRSREVQSYIPQTAPAVFCPEAIPSRILIQLSTNQKLLCQCAPLPPPSLSFITCAPALLPPQTLPTRMSPLGAFSPPHRGLLPQMDTHDVSVLWSPLFPRKRFIPSLAPERGPSCTPDKDAPVTVSELLMAEGRDDSAQLEKKDLLLAVGSSVDKIICHFNTSRKQVQKAQLGDSRLSPELGYLLLGGLCPSLYSLLSDGLKPFQRDVITGRRRLSPWGLVEASVKADSAKGALHSLFCRVSHLPPLQDPRRKFNAFIFGLLNMKQLDAWLSQVLQTAGLYTVFYGPTAFLTCAVTSNPALREELLLILQPLSALTFHVDLLFEHHHLPLQHIPAFNHHHHWQEPWPGSSFQQILQWGGQLLQRMAASTEKETAGSEDTEKRTRGGEDIEVTVDGGDTEKGASGGNDTQNASAPEPESRSSTRDNLTDSSRKWWEQLASRMYVPSVKGASSLTHMTRLGNWDKSEGKPGAEEEAGRQSAHEQCSRAPQKAFSEGEPQESDEGERHGERQPSEGRALKPGIDPCEDTLLQGSGSTLTDNGSVPASADTATCAKKSPPSEHLPRAAEGWGSWFGHLFGASLVNNRDAERKKAKCRPSSWLTPSLSEHMGKTNAGIPQDTNSQQRHTGHHNRSLRALCDHVGTGEAELSFKKGDVLQLLSTVDDDWIRCRYGDSTGLVPVGYTSLVLTASVLETHG